MPRRSKPADRGFARGSPKGTGHAIPADALPAVRSRARGRRATPGLWRLKPAGKPQTRTPPSSAQRSSPAYTEMYTRPPGFASMEQMKVLVTGITGMIGSHFAAACRARGWDVFGLARSTADSRLRARFRSERLPAGCSGRAGRRRHRRNCPAGHHRPFRGPGFQRPVVGVRGDHVRRQHSRDHEPGCGRRGRTHPRPRSCSRAAAPNTAASRPRSVR